MRRQTDIGTESASTEGAGTPSLPAAPARRNQRALLIASTPLLLLGGVCLFSAGQRLIANHGLEKPFGHLSPTEARAVASTVCAKATGQAVVSEDASTQSSYSTRRKTTIREWNVLCKTADGNVYLARINADTRRVYAINRMEGASHDSETGDVTRAEAEARARQYLGLVGVPSSNLKPISESASKSDDRGPLRNAQWNFTFSHKVPGMGDRLLKVSVDGKDGGLEHVWNPVSAL